MSEQELEDATQPKPGQVEESLQQADDELAFPDLKRGISWGESITKKRAAELETKLQRWRTGEEHEKHRSPFSYEKLTGADLYWWVMREIEEVSQIVADAPASVNTDIESYVLNLPLEGAWLDEAQLAGAHLSGANLKNAHLFRAHLEGANLELADLRNASLWEAQLESANLSITDLRHTSLIRAQMTNANLSAAHLEGTTFDGATLVGANLRRTFLDSGTSLKRAELGNADSGYICVADVSWGNVNLAVVDWTRRTRGFLGIGQRIEAIELGDEREARTDKDSNGKPKDDVMRLREFKDAVRANRQFATVLRQQGLNEDADRFAYKAQNLQREVFLRDQTIGGFIASLILWALSGYGYKLWRILVAYGLMLVAFAIIYVVLGVHSHTGEPGIQALWDSFLISLSAIHGRTVFEQLGAWTPAAWVAAVESVVGIVIEGVFVAMLIQRFFAR